MPGNPKRRRAGLLERFAARITAWSGSTTAFVSALSVVLLWAATGPLFDFSDTWQLVINTGTTVVTFLMVFLIQRAQNKDSQAVHVKLNELVAATKGASNRLIDVEDLSEEELRLLHRHFRHLVRMAARQHSMFDSHSVEEAEHRHIAKERGHGHEPRV